jgi:hypothetical protein
VSEGRVTELPSGPLIEASAAPPLESKATVSTSVGCEVSVAAIDGSLPELLVYTPAAVQFPADHHMRAL